MNQSTPSAATGGYAAAVAVCVAGILASAILTARGLAPLYTVTSGLTRVGAPGRHPLTLDEPGSYTVYYEYRGVLDGRAYATAEQPPDLRLELTSSETGAEVPLVGSTAPPGYWGSDAAGVALMDFVIDRPGRYELTATAAGGGDVPPVILAFGHDMTRRVNRAWLQVLGGVALCPGSVLAAGVLALVTFLRRRPPVNASSLR
jgi:hypothetical protein